MGIDEIWLKYSWSLTSFVKCVALLVKAQGWIQEWAKIGHGGSSSSSDWKDTATNQMHNDVRSRSMSKLNFLCVFDVYESFWCTYLNAICINFYLHLFFVMTFTDLYSKNICFQLCCYLQHSFFTKTSC